MAFSTGALLVAGNVANFELLTEDAVTAWTGNAAPSGKQFSAAVYLGDKTQFTTDTVHGLATGDFIIFSDVTGDTTWNDVALEITLIDTTHFSIDKYDASQNFTATPATYKTGAFNAVKQELDNFGTNGSWGTGVIESTHWNATKAGIAACGCETTTVDGNSLHTEIATAGAVYDLMEGGSYPIIL
jgi:hypothetical protein